MVLYGCRACVSGSNAPARNSSTQIIGAPASRLGDFLRIQLPKLRHRCLLLSLLFHEKECVVAKMAAQIQNSPPNWYSVTTRNSLHVFPPSMPVLSLLPYFPTSTTAVTGLFSTQLARAAAPASLSQNDLSTRMLDGPEGAWGFPVTWRDGVCAGIVSRGSSSAPRLRLCHAESIIFYASGWGGASLR